MRKIEERMVAAVKAAHKWRDGNTSVDVMGDGSVKVFLYDNLIATINTAAFNFTLAGWDTCTTRSRINALGNMFDGYPGVSHHKCTPFLFRHGKRVREIGSKEWVRCVK